ncbi:MAG: S-layer homology domain-containing protein [Chloroflexi bacterium]|nr:S-layer homology domain-containing protein [Chloroflexota bacterium]
MKRSLVFWLGLIIVSLSCSMIAGSSPSEKFQQSALPQQAPSKTYYVRIDGSSAQNCTGLVDAPYPGSGANQACAWDHPFRALPPTGTPLIVGGDTLIIGAGSYRMGYGAPGAANCDAGGAFDCLMPPIPSGPDAAHPTRILGAGWNTGCASPPQLWGAERPWFIVNLTDSSNVEIGCLEITDHSPCVESHSGGLACERDTPPYGNWASYGLYAEDSSNVYLHDLNVHGLASGGVHAGRLSNWTVERVRIAGNGSAGWDGDLWDDNGDSNSGNLIFRHFTVEWNGCGETYPGQQPTGCWAQSAGGYGDGFATGTSGGNWLIEDSLIRYNTSDGLDFLYVSQPGSSITIRRTVVEGNAGNQVKTFRGPFLLESSIIVGNCGFFDGQPFTYNVDNCRALGTALAIGLAGGDQAIITNNTFTSEGDCLVTAECEGSCGGSETVLLRNNIFQGQTDFLQPFEQTCLVYQETFASNPFNMDYSLVNNVKEDACFGSHSMCGVSPGLTNISADNFDANLLQASPAIDAADNASCAVKDVRGLSRPLDGDQDGVSVCDMGAYEGPAIATTFADVPADHWAWQYIERLYQAGITGGCGISPLIYCPSVPVTRAQVAIFILRGIHGSVYAPPPATGAVFSDVPSGSFAADWIEQLAAEGVTAGCGGGNYCPDSSITRAQMAIFLLRGEHGSDYTPPPATGTVFGDVPTDSFAADWIEQLALEGITAGCGGGNYCPGFPVTRAEMAVFLVRAFDLP